ncbi:MULTISPECIES: polysaccharide deacetylase family protein [Frankia]|uniref:polysaccharide deacetylase family protein n=1 Tax=Frankia TaxID=1854 RepID=UPI001F274AB3|nr:MULTISPECIES: polysaccharide deacetylase family protein [Frankia]
MVGPDVLDPKPDRLVPSRGCLSAAVALTIDDGPHPVWTPRMLDVLRRNRVQATFCLVGAQAHAHRDLVGRIIAEGHSVCNHAMTHPQPFSHRTPAQIRAEMVRAQSVIVDAGGKPPRLFRAPGGDWSPAVLAAAANLGMTAIGWDVDPRDWARPGTPRIVRSLTAARPRPGPRPAVMVTWCFVDRGSPSVRVHRHRAGHVPGVGHGRSSR